MLDKSVGTGSKKVKPERRLSTFSSMAFIFGRKLCACQCFLASKEREVESLTALHFASKLIFSSHASMYVCSARTSVSFDLAWRTKAFEGSEATEDAAACGIEGFEPAEGLVGGKIDACDRSPDSCVEVTIRGLFGA